MVDPVVSSRFGKRPLLDIPAMQVSSTSQRAVQSLQNQVPPLHLDAYEPGLPRAGDVVPRPYHTAPPPEPFYYNGHPREYDHYYGPHGEVVKPLPHYYHPHDRYPGVHILPHTSPQPYHPPPPPPPPPASVPVPVPVPVVQPVPYPRKPVHYEPRPQTFDVTCELDYGRVAHISVRESHGHFRGIPDYLRQELMRTYGKYPFMEVKVRFENGDYHIYANHDRERRRQQRRDEYERPRYRTYEEDNDYYEDRGDHRQDDEETLSDGIRPREMGAPRNIIREQGWNNYR